MDAQDVVREAITALMAGDVVSHLALVSQDVIVQLNENPQQTGKAAYQEMLEALRICHEVISSFRIEDVTVAGRETVVRVREVHEVPYRHGAYLRIHRETLTSFYTVDDHCISQVKLSALSSPNRVFRFP